MTKLEDALRHVQEAALVIGGLAEQAKHHAEKLTKAYAVLEAEMDKKSAKENGPARHTPLQTLIWKAVNKRPNVILTAYGVVEAVKEDGGKTLKSAQVAPILNRFAARGHITKLHYNTYKYTPSVQAGTPAPSNDYRPGFKSVMGA